ncbi:MAG: D-alanine--D-alanine ligase [Aquificae bacterium]|nr:D-alanine--D-alanine ligase [Aquificota bacterium]
MRLVVLMGGRSSEREISLKTGRAVAKALRDLGHEVHELDLTPDLPCKLLELKPDKVFIALHGRYGEDGTVQGMLEVLGIPYTGSDTITSALCMDKDFTKRVVSSLGIDTPRWAVVLGEEDLEKLKWEVFPAVVKPAREGSSIGLQVVRIREDLLGSLREILKKGERALVEEFVEGRDVTVGFLKGRVLPPLEIIPKKGIYDYECKYTSGMSEYRILPEGPLKETLQKKTEKICRYLSLKDFGRIDYRISREGKIYFLEVNTIPGLTELSLLPMAAREVGIDFRELVSIIIS